MEKVTTKALIAEGLRNVNAVRTETYLRTIQTLQFCNCLLDNFVFERQCFVSFFNVLLKNVLLVGMSLAIVAGIESVKLRCLKKKSS